MSTSLHTQPRLKTKGFTLIELMVVVAIIGILAGVAYPSYTDYVRRGQVTEALTQLSTLRGKMEQYYQDNRNYGAANACATDASANSWNGFAATDHFSYVCTTSAPNQTYTITASGVDGSAVSGSVYAINEQGTRSTTKFKGATVASQCWLVKGSEC